MLDYIKGVRNHYRETNRKRYLEKQRKRLKNKDICLISSTCNGACILHDLELQFYSPFVNLWMKPQDYIRMLKNLKEYMSYELEFVSEDGIKYPIGRLKDVQIYFMHYKTEEEAKKKWDERVKRMDYDHIFILFSDRDNCTEEDLKEFDQLPWKHKKVFVNHPHPEIESAVYIRGFENEESVGICSSYRNKISYKKYYDQFDYVGWFNCEDV